MGRRNFFGIKSSAVRDETSKNKNVSKALKDKLSNRELNSNRNRNAKGSISKRQRSEKGKLVVDNPNRSIRNKNKTKKETVKQMLQNFPKDPRKSNYSASYDITADYHHPIQSSDDEEESRMLTAKENDYASRKLLIRQMQGIIAKEAQVGSEYDSWSDLEDNFAKTYEPIPLDIDIDTWKRMSKVDILNTVRSKKIRKDFEYMTHSEILTQIEKMQNSARYLSEKFGINHLLPHMDKHVAMVHRSNEEDSSDNADEIQENENLSETQSNGTNFSRNVPEYLSRSEILRAYKNKNEPSKRGSHKSELSNKTKNEKKNPHHDSWSSRASSILNNPEQIYMSREELIKKLHQRNKNNIQSTPQQPTINQSITTTNKPNSIIKHDSWSSSIMNKKPLKNRNETIEKLQTISDTETTYSNSSICSCSSSSSSTTNYSSTSQSSASTVKNVILKSRIELNSLGFVKKKRSNSQSSGNKNKTEKSPQPKESLLNKAISKSRSSVSDTKSRSSIGSSKEREDSYFINKEAEIIKPKENFNRLEQELRDSRPMLNKIDSQKDSQLECGSNCSCGETSIYSYNSDYDTCSCTSCEIYTDCSCCGEDGIYHGIDQSSDSYSSQGSSCSSSCSTVIDGHYHEPQFSDDIASHNSGRAISNNSNKEQINSDKDSSRSYRSHQSKHSKNSKGSASKVGSSKESILSSSSSSKSSSKSKRKEIIVAKDNEQLITDSRMNKKAVKQHLRELATEWDSKINDLNTLRRGHVLTELKKYLREEVDFDTVQPEELNRQVEVLLREALDSNFEALSNKNVGQMYIPEMLATSSKLNNKDNTTDYDTFGSLDSLIFEPKVGSKKYIKKAQDAIDKQFQYLNQEDGGEDSQDDMKYTLKKSLNKNKDNISGPGKTTFAERVMLFQNLGKDKEPLNNEPTQRPMKKITFLDIRGQETSWKELAGKKDDEEDDFIGEMNNKFQDQLDDPGQEVSLCPECNNPVDLSFTTCSICDSCCENANNENSIRKPSALIASHSWNYLGTPLKSDDDDNEASCDSINYPENKNNIGDNNNLRRQLKEAFGSSALDMKSNFEVKRNDSVFDLSSSQEADNVLEVVQNVNATASFLEEYANRTSLLPNQMSATNQSSSAVLLRSEGAVELTEEMFRGELKGTLKKIATNQPSPKDSKRQQGSEMGDSGISSPPAASSLMPNAGISRSPERIDEEDSGMDDFPNSTNVNAIEEKKIGIPLMPKRDTMIRELKSKLKEKFHGDSTSSSEDNSLTIDNKTEHQVLPAGTVNSRRELMGAKLGKLFGESILKQQIVQSRMEILETKSPIPKSQQQQQHPMKPITNDLIPPVLPPKMVISSTVTSSSTVQKSIAAKSTTTTTTTTFKNLYENKDGIRTKAESVDSSQKATPVEYFSSESEEGSVYNPSLPEELKKNIPAGIMFRSNRPFTPPTNVTLKNLHMKRLEKKIDQHKNHESTCNGCGNAKCQEVVSTNKIADASPAERREFLYGPGGIFGPKGPFSTPMVRYPNGLEVVNQHSKRTVSFETSNGTKATSNLFTDSSTAIIVEENTVKGQFAPSPVLNMSEDELNNKVPVSRMETYRAEWAEQECVPSKPDSKPLIPDDVERWKEEKARRMLTWINSSQLNGYWGSEIPWWKVGIQSTSGGDDPMSFFDSLNVPPNTPAQTTSVVSNSDTAQ